MKLKLFLVAAVFAAAATHTTTASADQLDEIRAVGTLNCGVLTNSPPLGFQDPNTREPAGYEIDLCGMFAAHIGVKPKLTPVSPQTRMAELTQGRVDILASLLSYSKERAEQVDFSGAYIAEDFNFVVLDASDIKTVDDLAGQRIGLVKGSVLIPLTEKRLPDARVLSFETSAASFLALQQGKVKATVYRYSEGKAVQRNAGDDIKALRFLDEPLLSMPSGFAFRKGSPELVKAADEFLASIEKNGEGQKLYDKWLGKDSDLKATRKFEFGKPQPTWFTN
ncbi:transporter substrate-binding domain-containing protein [Sinorhizobium meliloti]|uniref:transporter substrate-binding domain-containing protein n=1 Tax=Rhizobium meliloti TaxID=382 RepID=UPI000B4975CA|nr:transporter substrate-binding domain-containing protein [Sinorhizobium meliloti]ASP93453.1 amino acid ABC transporter substrate-binding protein [Sinorhizobium meliloti]MQX60561.1 transporter substrate-binding domain-containing protein [Sinorhizobium meliloti]